MDEWARQEQAKRDSDRARDAAEQANQAGMAATDALNRLFAMLARDHEHQVRDANETRAAALDAWDAWDASQTSAEPLGGVAAPEPRRWEVTDGWNDPSGDRAGRADTRLGPDRFERPADRLPVDTGHGSGRDTRPDQFDPAPPRHRPDPPPAVNDAPRQPVTPAERATVQDVVDGMRSAYEEYRSRAAVERQAGEARAAALSPSERQDLLLASTSTDPTVRSMADAREAQRTEWLYWNDPVTGFWAWLRRQDEFADRRRQEVLAAMEADSIDRATWADVPADTALVRYRSTADAVAAGRTDGLEDLAAGRLGFFRYNRRGSVGRRLGPEYAGWQAAHVVPKAIGQFIPGYSPGTALTVLLPASFNAAFDKTWLAEWRRARQNGAGITVGEAYTMLADAINAIPDAEMPPAARDTLRERLRLEMFGELGLRPEMQLVSPTVEWP
jgi:uncharacterized membrane protein